MMSSAFPSPGHQPTRPDGGAVHVSARVSMVAKAIRAETARVDASDKGTRDKRRRKGDLFTEFFIILVIVFMCFLLSLFLFEIFRRKF